MKRQSHRHPHKPRAAGESVPIAQRLRAESRKLTGPRRAIIAALEEQAHPLTIREIHACIGESECDLATIYRAMHLLEKMRIVSRFDFGDAVARYELVRHESDEHHHHLICTDCAKVVEIDECFPQELERKIASGNGFAQIRHKLEFFGVCPGCQTK
ncbi:MAG: Fur family transcriptional regulator [Limisphaerales bacterium]